MTETDSQMRGPTEEALRENQFMKTLLDSLPGIFYLYSYPGLRLVNWNKNHETLLGFTPEEVKGRSIVEFHPPEANEAVLEAVEMVMKNGHNMIESPSVGEGWPSGSVYPDRRQAGRFRSTISHGHGN